MEVVSLESRLVQPGDSVFAVFSEALARARFRLRTDDVVAVSSKIVGVAENKIKRLETVKPTRKAKSLARKFSLTAEFAQAVMEESDRVVGGVSGALLTIKNGDAVANAGIDRKNAPHDSVVSWPSDPDLTAQILLNQIRKRFGKRVGVIIVDSRVSPMRLGTTGFAIGLAGFRPVEDIRGTRDLFDRRIRITYRAIADSLATAAQFVMGEAAERKPFAIIRDAQVQLSRGGGIDEANLPWRQCLYMRQVMTNAPKAKA